MVKLTEITCPTCGKPNTWHSENSFKPFCSDRCKLIDLGEWANETRQIPGNSNDPESTLEMDTDEDSFS